MSASIRLNDFTTKPNDPWHILAQGQAKLALRGQTLGLINENTRVSSYTNAQLDDYQGLSRPQFRWRPPLTMSVQARFSHPVGVLRGTGGFGFWNDPFAMTETRWPAWPRALWFFYASPPSNMKLDQQEPGFGWKAATIDARRWPFFALLPLAPIAIPLMNIPWLYHRCWPVGQRAISVSEASIPAEMTDWHTYTLIWQAQQVRFLVDDAYILDGHTTPSGPLGFVAWLDNQYMIITPWGQFRYGLLETNEQQWLEISALAIIQG